MEIKELAEKDISFQVDDFLAKANHRIKRILNSVSFNELDKVKHFMNWEVYDNFLDSIQNYEIEGERLVYDEVNVSSQISTLEETDEVYSIWVDANVKYLRYVVNKNGDVVQGDANARISTTLKINFQKAKDARPLEEVTRCLGCGTSFNIDESGICPHCGRTFDLDQFDYIITEWNQ